MQHLDEAHVRTEDYLSKWIDKKTGGWRILVVKDVLGMLRIILWCSKKDWESSRIEIDHELMKISTEYWSRSVLQGQQKNHPDGAWQSEAWKKAERYEGTDKLRIMDRHLSKSGWFEAPSEPPWKTRVRNAPAIVLFYSFKGGAGRSTALAATALNLAASGDRVAVLDADLDAPGVASLLAGHDGTTAQWGIVDYLLERRIRETMEGRTDDYRHRYAAGGVVEATEEIFVYPAGTFDNRYVDKLARVDYGNPPDSSVHPFVALLEHIRRDLAPRWILIDSRAGLGDVSGFLTGGLCHFHVLLGTLADASWQGLERILERLGGNRIREDRPQAECLLVASMVPRSDESLFQRLVQGFTDRARDAFGSHYYAEPEEAPDNFWTLDDMESDDAPHVPVVLPYDERLATFRDLREVAQSILLKEGPYRELTDRLRSSLKRSGGLVR